MKKFLLVILMVIVSITYTTASVNTITDNKPTVEYMTSSTDEIFSTIKIGFPAILSVCEADSFGIYINSIDDNIDNIKYEIKNQTLNIWIENVDYIENINSKHTRITIMTNNINNLNIKAANSNLQIISRPHKKNSLANYGNN